MNCFPIALQAASTEEDFQTEIDLFAELAGSVLSFAEKVASTIATKHEAVMTAPLNEAQKVRLAQDPETPTSLLTELSSDKSSAVRNQLIFNPSTPSSVLSKLANDKDQFVRAQARMRATMAA